MTESKIPTAISCTAHEGRGLYQFDEMRVAVGHALALEVEAIAIGRPDRWASLLCWQLDGDLLLDLRSALTGRSPSVGGY